MFARMMRRHVRLLRNARFCALVAAVLFDADANGASPEEARELLRRGAYQDAIQRSERGAHDDPRNEEWRLIQCEGLLAAGWLKEAKEIAAKAIEEFRTSLRLRVLAHEIFRQGGQPDRAKEILAEMDRLAALREWAYRDPQNRIALGKAALLAGADPKRVLDVFFDPVIKANPELRDGWLASGDLALGKNDSRLAARFFGEAAKKFPGDAEVQFGLARAYEPSDTPAMLAAIEKVLAANSSHVGARLLLAEHYIDAEQLDKAETTLAEVLRVNPSKPEAWALHAVIAELRANFDAAKTARETALKPWPANPVVDHLIGRKLSQKYRFAEGAARQRQALAFDADFAPAKIQLAQDLLRLGVDEEGWQLADEAQKADPYDVVAYNLTTLRDSIAHFQTLTSEHFVLRMDPGEAALYGDKALALLERAHATLTKKYGQIPRERTIVEIFPDQKDFAIRTFGLPGGAGYLGVCFGRVVTANSPASRQGSPANWEAILWHEFCHVVTLQLTKNKMPRWLSEGISVYEERQARSNWGEQMSPRYRAMILGDDLTPVSQLSGAFLKPKTPAHLQFAYYESSLVVEYLIERFGLEKLKRILADLGAGVAINAAIEKHAAPLEKIDREFAERARQLARDTGRGLDWTKPKAADFADEEARRKFFESNPTNFTALTEQARTLIAAGDLEAAKAPLKKLLEMLPDESAWGLLAKIHRELGETEQELAALNRLADLSAEATDAYARLMELAAGRKDWTAVLANAARYEAVNPLRPEPHRFSAEAHEALGKSQPAIVSYRKLLRLEPPDAPKIHFRLARLLHGAGDPAAKRHVLMALEEAPRFRAAHELLLEISGKGGR